MGSRVKRKRGEKIGKVERKREGCPKKLFNIGRNPEGE